MAKEKIRVNLWHIFSEHGEIEEAYFIPESEVQKPITYTIIGYVLFKTEALADQVIALGKIELDQTSSILIKKIEDKKTKQRLTKGKGATLQEQSLQTLKFNSASSNSLGLQDNSKSRKGFTQDKNLQTKPL